MEVSMKYGFGMYREIIKWGKKMSLDSMKKKKESEQKSHGFWKKYGFEKCKEIKGMKAEKMTVRRSIKVVSVKK